MNPNLSFFKDRDDPTQIRLRGHSEEGFQPLLNGRRAGMAQPDQNYSHPGDGKELEKQSGEIQVHGDHRSSFLTGSLQDRFIGGLGQAEVSGMDCIVPLRSKPCCCPLRHRHVEQEFHSGLGSGGERERLFAS